jgi:hypothetical protein
VNKDFRDIKAGKYADLKKNWPSGSGMLQTDISMANMILLR